MIDKIRSALAQISSDQDVRVLYAVESGSRAWGFASADSDWDVRFIYVRPIEAYLSIVPRRDVIEAQLPGDLDVSGWDLPKALGLFAKTNPPLFEWLRSPIVYAEDAQFMSQLRALEPNYLRLEAGLYHYRSMALTTHRTYLEKEGHIYT